MDICSFRFLTLHFFKLLIHRSFVMNSDRLNNDFYGLRCNKSVQQTSDSILVFAEINFFRINHHQGRPQFLKEQKICFIVLHLIKTNTLVQGVVSDSHGHHLRKGR